MQVRDVVAQLTDIDFGRLRHLARLFFEELGEMPHVVRVGLDCQLGRVSFDLQVVEKLADGGLHDSD